MTQKKKYTVISFPYNKNKTLECMKWCEERMGRTAAFTADEYARGEEVFTVYLFPEDNLINSEWSFDSKMGLSLFYFKDEKKALLFSMTFS